MLAPHRASGLAPILGGCRRAIVGLALMSGLVNLLYLTGSFFMLQVYDRVIPSRSVPTLIGLSVLALALYAFQGGLEILRARTLVRVGGIVDEALGPRVFDAAVRAPLVGTMPGDGLLPVRDLDALRSFLSGPAPGALFDLPWIPFYVGICCVFHPLIGIAALLGGAALVALTLLTDRLTRAPTREASGLMARRNGLIEAGRRNAESLAALGMRTVFMNRWSAAGRDYRALQQVLADVGGGFGPRRRSSASRCNPGSWPSGPISSSRARPRRASSSPARSSSRARSRRSSWQSPIGAASSAPGKAGPASKASSPRCRRSRTSRNCRHRAKRCACNPSASPLLRFSASCCTTSVSRSKRVILSASSGRAPRVSRR